MLRVFIKIPRKHRANPIAARSIHSRFLITQKLATNPGMPDRSGKIGAMLRSNVSAPSMIEATARRLFSSDQLRFPGLSRNILTVHLFGFVKFTTIV